LPQYVPAIAAACMKYIGKSNHPIVMFQQEQGGGTKTDRRPTVSVGFTTA